MDVWYDGWPADAGKGVQQQPAVPGS